MESTTTSYSLNIPALLRRRNSSPDVPEDVDYVMAHFNDPNWDLTTPPTATTATFAEKGQTSSWSEQSFRETESDSQFDSTQGGTSKFDLREAKIEEFEYVPFLCSATFITDARYTRDSPYAEVRAAVPSTDDTTIPVNTFRAYVCTTCT